MQHQERWDAADEQRRTGEPVDAQVSEANRGGLIVRVLGFRAFLPMSQVLPDATGDWTRLVGQDITVQLLEVNQRRHRIIVRQVVTPTGPASSPP